MNSNQFLEKPSPSAVDAEGTILGAILIDNRVAGEVFANVSPADFFSPNNRKIAEVMRLFMRQGKSIDPILIGEELKRQGTLDSIGGASSITNLTFGLPHISDTKEYCDLIRKKSLARRLINDFSTGTRELLAEDEDADVILDKIITTLIAHKSNTVGKTQSMGEVVDNVMAVFDAWAAGNENVSSVKTGIPELDGFLKLKGLAYGEMTLVAARPSVGKTSILLQTALHVARLGVPVLFISLEMLKEKLVMRCLPATTLMPNRSINPDTFQNFPDQGNVLRQALIQFKSLPIYFDRSFALSQLIATGEYYAQTKGVKLIIFDYLTLIHGNLNKNANRDTEVGFISNSMKELAVRTDTAVFGAAQLNRESEKECRRPRKSDLRDSGMIEQAVDTLIFPWDADMKSHIKNPDSIRDGLWLDLYCDKQRDGESGWTVPVYYDKNLQTMESPRMGGRTPPVKVEPEKPLPPVVPHWQETERDTDVF